MTVRELEADYLIIGTGAMGMAFADEVMLQDPTQRLIMVDRHAKPGGHWNDAYSFVSLHQPAAYYGVNSEILGTGGASLASGTEVLAYYERVMKKLVGTGKLIHFPMCEVREGGHFVSLVDQELEYQVEVRKKIVDSTYMDVHVPSIRDPEYDVAPEVSVVPPNDLPNIRKPSPQYVIIGAGKTGMDAVLFLLDRGIDPDRVTWIVSNDAWLLNRAHIQPGRMSRDGLGSNMESFRDAETVDELFVSLESRGRILRLDEGVWPTRYRCATVSSVELEQMRRVRHVVRMGRVVRVEPSLIVLEGGELPAHPDALYVDCTADGLSRREVRPLFEGQRVTLQSMVMCQQVFSASVAGYIESRYDDDEEKNKLCRVVAHPNEPRDFVMAMAISMKNLDSWAREFRGWLRRSRLSAVHHEPILELIRSGLQARKIVPMAAEKMRLMMQNEFPEDALKTVGFEEGV
ncbi:NAD(P)/FAD-dependent oxidoreductase [Myxococcota bacterium]|nr:NAD(P)/FAD-dependent oxidoreductase [Myxococcota bacterium]